MSQGRGRTQNILEEESEIKEWTEAPEWSSKETKILLFLLVPPSQKGPLLWTTSLFVERLSIVLEHLS